MIIPANAPSQQAPTRKIFFWENKLTMNFLAKRMMLRVLNIDDIEGMSLVAESKASTKMKIRQMTGRNIQPP